MKNKIKIMLILMLFMLPFNVKALTGSMELSCSKTSVSPGETITCTIKGTSDDEVSSLSSKITVSSNLSIGDVTVDSIWEGTGEANLDLYTDKNKTGTFAIATFTVKAASNVTSGSNEQITLGSTKFYDGNYDGFDVVDIKKSINILSTVNTLSGITLSSGTLSPSFSSGTTNYFATVDAPKVTISATKTDGKSTISGSAGEVSLNYGGENIFRINVTSESGSTKTYTITITRPDNRDKNNSLSSLSLNGEVIKLKSDVSEYSYEVENDVTQMRLEAVLDSAKATFDKNYGPRTVDLKEGENLIEIKIIAENEKTRTYTLNIKRKAPVIEGDPGTGDNPGDSGGNSGNETIPDSPPTGSLALYIVLAIVVISIAGLVYYFNQYQKKQVNNSNDEK